MTASYEVAANAIELGGLAESINSEHELALRDASSAIEHAKAAGRLLLKAKEMVGHGNFLAWLPGRVNVSPRQCQRYMRAALGKPFSVRQIKSDTAVAFEGNPAPDDGFDARRQALETLTYLRQSAPATSWVHRVEELGLSDRRGAALVAADGDDVWIEPLGGGLFGVSKLNSRTWIVEHFGRPTTLAGVAIALDQWSLHSDVASAMPKCDVSTFWEGFQRPLSEKYKAAHEMGLVA